MSRKPLTAFVICVNEAHQIRRCLQSVAWCDHIVVVDSGSTDGTVEICREFTDKVFHHEWQGYGHQKRYALERCETEWILNIDADEEVSPKLREEIERVLAGPDDPRVNGYLLSRVVYYMNRWWRHGGWYPEYRLRLCRRGKTHWSGSEPHEKARVEGATLKLRGELHHYTYKDMDAHIKALNGHATAAANWLVEQGKSVGLFDILTHSFARFVKFYVIKRGFLEGAAGLIVAILESYYTFIKYSKAWYRQRY